MEKGNMALSDDSPPFVVLQRSAEEFKSALDADVSKCLGELNSKITSLMMDPDSLGGSSGPKSNAHVEFSMAKYKILAHMKGVYEEVEKEWMDHLAEMKAEFIENIEVFLANTKLEVKLPILNVSPRSILRNSPSAVKVVKQDKSPSTVSSLYPKLFNTAKHIPVLSSLLPHQQEEEMSEEEEPLPPIKKTMGRTPKRVTINTSEEYMPSPGQNGTSRRRVTMPVPEVSNMVENSDEESEDEVKVEEPVVQTPVKRAGRGRKSIVNTSAKKDTVITPLRGRYASKNEIGNDSSSNEEIVPVIETGRRGRKSMKAQPPVEAVISTPGKRGRTPRKKANDVQTVILEDPDLDEMESVIASEKTPKQVQFSMGLDVNEDLEIYSPELNLQKSAPRRKTMVVHAAENVSDICQTPEAVRSKSKRKTIGGNLLDQSVAPSPKRLKRCGGRSSLAPSALDHDEAMDTNLLESEGAADMGRYSPWIPLTDISGNVPPKAGVYELKVAQAKKPAFIGACDSLRQKLTLHKMAHSSGHKHLDKFVERNSSNILVRYEHMPSAAVATDEAKKRVKNFVACYKTSPAYN